MNLINYFYHYKDSSRKINTKHECLFNLIFKRSQKSFYSDEFYVFVGKKAFSRVFRLVEIIFTSYKNYYGE